MCLAREAYRCAGLAGFVYVYVSTFRVRSGKAKARLLVILRFASRRSAADATSALGQSRAAKLSRDRAPHRASLRPSRRSRDNHEVLDWFRWLAAVLRPRRKRSRGGRRYTGKEGKGVGEEERRARARVLRNGLCNDTVELLIILLCKITRRWRSLSECTRVCVCVFFFSNVYVSVGFRSVGMSTKLASACHGRSRATKSIRTLPRNVRGLFSGDLARGHRAR